jgi:hypothetical protein
MTLTLNIEPQDEAAAVRELLSDFRNLAKLRLKRPNITAARIVGAGKLLNVFDEIEQQLPAAQPQPEGLAA